MINLSFKDKVFNNDKMNEILYSYFARQCLFILFIEEALEICYIKNR